MDIKHILFALWTKKWIIIALPMISLVVAILSTRNIKPIYRASTQIATGFTTNEGVNLTDEKFNLRTSDVKFNNLLAIMNSGTIFNMVSYRLMINRLDSAAQEFSNYSPEEIAKAKKVLERKLLTLTTITINDDQSDLLRSLLNKAGYTFSRIKGGFEIKRVPNTDFVAVSFTSGNPSLCAKTVNIYCTEFLRYYTNTKKETSGESVDFFQELVARKSDELQNKSEALRIFKAKNNISTTSNSNETQLNQVYVLENQRDQINNNLYALRLKLSSLENSIKEKLGQTEGSSASPANQRIIILKKKINNLNDRFINTGSNDSQILDSLNLLQQQYRVELSMMGQPSSAIQSSGLTTSELRTAVQQTNIDIQVEESKLKMVNGNIFSIRSSFSGYANTEAMLNTLDRDVKVATDEYLSAVDKYNEAQDKLLASAGSIRQVYLASPPASPEPSKRLIIIILAAFASFALSVFAIILLEIFDATIKTPMLFQRMVDMPLAGSIIKIDVKKLNFTTLFEQKHDNSELEIFKHFLRKIRYEVEQTNAQVFLITSPKEGEGKTFIIFSLAYVLSLIKKKVLIIDTNFKRNTLTKWLATSKKKTKFIDQHSIQNKLQIINPDDNFDKVNDESHLISPTKYKNISIIGNAGGNDSPEEIFHSKDFSSLISGLKDKYDYILMEGSSLNEYSDTKELIKYAEKIIPVFSADSSIKPLDKESIEFLKAQGSKLGSAILNKVDPKNINL
ncbi:MAG: succinoglycan biosynthesis transport protein ExoP [Sediminicola sp.]|jgi:succinoglycan biosynthesis transport protein ExoP